MITINDVFNNSVSLPLNEIDILLSHVLQKPKEFLYGHPEYILKSNQFKTLQKLITRRSAGEPIAYLTGEKEFYGLPFLVNRHVLIPRPDTELLVADVLEYLHSRYAIYRVPTIKKPIIADIGTGSGNIAVTIKKYFPKCTMIATDISKRALHIAQKNAKLNRTAIQCYASDVLTGIPKKFHKQLNVITFNAPYLTKTQARKKNLAYEPQLALTPTGKPTELIEQLLQQAPHYLNPKQAVLFFEIGHTQGEQVKTLCKKYFPKARVTVTKDLGNYDRLVRCIIS